MAAGPQRAASPAAHVTAHIAPVERALLERARVLEATSSQVPEGHPDERCAEVYAYMAAEFRALAAELHHWQ